MEIQYRETGNLQEDIAQLAQAPGLAWMGDLLERDDIDWQAVQEVHNQWNKSDSGIGGPGMQLVSLAMALALSLTPGGQGFATGVLGLAEEGVMTAAVAAGFNALVIQAGMQVVGNGGDIGAALEALASIDTVRILATAMLTAGLMQGLENADFMKEFVGTGAAEGAEGMDKFIAHLAQKLKQNAIQAGVNTGVGTAIYGGDLGENLVANLRGAAVSALGAQLANEIGEAYDNGNGDIDYVAHKIAHAALGGAIDLANGGDGVSGAVGGVVGEITAEALANEIEESFRSGEISEEQALRWENAGVDIAKLSAGLVAAAGGLNIDAAASAAGNAAENNAFKSLLSLIYHLTKDKYVLTEEDKAKDGAMLTMCIATYEENVDTGDYVEVSSDELSARGIHLVDSDSGLEGKVFYNKNTNELVVAFKGTDMMSLNDWETNAAQASGNVGKQYEQVAAMVPLIQKMANDYNASLVATGHSLGGGLASALASSGVADSAIVFNPSGLHENTAAAFGGDLDTASSVTTTYVSKGDVLNFAQQYWLEYGGIDVGSILPDSVGDQRIIEDAGFHSIGGFKDAFGLY